jgi:hypothetical protein
VIHVPLRRRHCCQAHADLEEQCPPIRARRLEGSYKPQPVRARRDTEGIGRQMRARHSNGSFIQQAAMQMLRAAWDLLRGELRLPARALGASGRSAGARADRVRATT